MLSAPNISAREQRWSLSQNLSCHLASRQGILKLGQYSELLRISLSAFGLKGRAYSLISRVNQSCQLVKPQQSAWGLQMKSLQLIRARAASQSHPSGRLFMWASESEESSIFPQTSQMGFKYLLTSSRAKKVRPDSVFSRSITSAQKGTPIMSSSEKAGGVLVTSANWSSSQSQVMLQLMARRGGRAVMVPSSASTYSWTYLGISSRPAWRYILAMGFSRMYLLKSSTSWTGKTGLVSLPQVLVAPNFIFLCSFLHQLLTALCFPSRIFPLLAHQASPFVEKERVSLLRSIIAQYYQSFVRYLHLTPLLLTQAPKTILRYQKMDFTIYNSKHHQNSTHDLNNILVWSELAGSVKLG